MSGRTPRWGFNWFDGDSQTGALSDDGNKFSGTDRLLLDRLLAAIETHDHGTVTDSDDAPDAPTPTYASTGGALEAGVTYYYKITLVNAAGLETDASDEVSVALPTQLDAPAAPGQGTGTSGTLTPGLYYYALTAVRGSEESALGDPVVVTVLSDEHQVALTMPALGSATSFRLWRLSDAEGFWRKFSTIITGSTFTDDGSVTPVATDAPTANTGVATYAITLALSTADATTVQATAVSGWKVYRSTTSGTYGGNSLVHNVTEHTIDTDPTSPKLTSWIDTGDALLPGAPPVTASKMHFVPLTTGGGGGAGLTVLGDWDAALTYSSGDIVMRYGTHYRATGAVPAAKDPWVSPAPATVDTERAATYQTSTASFGFYNMAQAFTVGASDITVDTLHISTLIGYGVGGADVGIATAIGADPSAVVWLSGAGPVSASFPNATTEFAVSLPNTVTLRAGQTYYIVAVSTSGSGGRNWKYHQNHLSRNTGDIASVAVLKSSMSGSWTGGSSPQYGLVWRLSEHTPEPPYWRALTPPAKGLWSPDGVYSIGDLVTWRTGLFRSLEDGNAGYEPSNDPHTAAWQITSDGTDRLGTATDQAMFIQFGAATNVHAIQLYLGSGAVTGRLTVKLVKDTGSGPAAGIVLAERTVDVASESGWKIVSFGRSIPVEVDTAANYYVVTHGLTVGSVDDTHLSGDPGFLEFGTPAILEGSSYTETAGYQMMMTVEVGPSTPWEVVAFLVPPGGATGQVLTKTSGRAGHYGWA